MWVQTLKILSFRYINDWILQPLRAYSDQFSWCHKIMIHIHISMKKLIASFVINHDFNFSFMWVLHASCELHEISSHIGLYRFFNVSDIKAVFSAHLMRTSSHGLGAYIIAGEDEPLQFFSSSSSSLYVFSFIVFFWVF